jgi:hypothetical protein
VRFIEEPHELLVLVCEMIGEERNEAAVFCTSAPCGEPFEGAVACIEQEHIGDVLVHPAMIENCRCHLVSAGVGG